MQKNKPLRFFITTTLAVTCFLSAQLSYAEDASDISSTAALLAGGAVAGAGIGIAASGHAGSNPEDKSFCDLNCRTYLQKKLDDYRIKNNIPAMTMTVNKGDATLNFYSGTMAKNSSVPVDQNSLFEIGSVTKTLTAVIILQLEAESKLNIEDKISKYLPEYSGWGNITIKQLLNMTGGAYDYSDDAFVDKMFTNPEHILSWKEVLDRAYYHIPNTDFAPGTKLEYSNTNYTLAGLIIERVTHKTFKENLETRISRPLGLKHTLYDPNLIPSHLSNMVHGYWEIPDSYYNTDTTNQAVGSFCNSGGGVISTAEDTAKWTRALFSTHRLLPEKQFQEMKILVGADGAPLPPDPQTPGFSLGMEWYPLRAFGFDLPGGAWDKGGQTMGYVHYWQYFPERDFIITTATDVVSDASLRNAYFGIEVFNYLLITRKI